MTIYRGAGGSGDATNDATVTAVAAYAAQAATSATNSANSATTSESSATNSASSASNAAASASAAATSASQAASSQSAAATSATTAANSATTAGTQATVATNQANDAANSATSAFNSASTATTKAAEAATSASNAATSATNSANSAASALAIYGNTTAMNNAVTSATTSAANAAISASQAATSSGTASDFATQAGIYSGQAGSYASAAANSASNAATSANNAAAIYGGISAVNAAVTQAANSATASSASSSAAQTSANSAATSATNAANSATQAANSAASAAAIVTGVASNRPNIRPSLLLDFANTKQLDPRITFSRPTTATYYDGKTVVKAEENLLLQSDNFLSVSWPYVGLSITTNTTTAPDGTTTADTLTTAAQTSQFFCSQTTSYLAAQYTFSIFLKQNTQRYAQIRFGAALITGGSGYANFDLQSGTVGTVGSGLTNASITSFGNGWYRCVVTGSTAAASGAIAVYLVTSATSASAESWTAAGTESIYIWGAQLEQRSTATAYTPTTTAPITNYIPALQTAVSNAARFDHDPVTGESKGLLIEEQRTNLLKYSEDFTNALWLASGTATITSNTVVSPDGTLSADTVDSSGSYSGRYQFASITSGTTSYTFSVFVKAGTNSLIRLRNRIYNGTTAVDVNTYFNLTTGAITGGTGTITPVGNGWYRLSVTATDNASGNTAVNGFVLDNNAAGSFYIWGAQLEAGSFPTSYIPTVASQVTRSADSASMTGSNFSSWYRADEGTGYVEMSGANSSNTYGAVIGNGTSAERIAFAANTLRVVASGTDQCNISSGAFTSYTFFKSAGVYKANDFAISVNGGAVATDTSGSVSVPTMLFIGNNGAGAAMNSTIKRIAYYPKRLSNTELQGLTS